MSTQRPPRPSAFISGTSRTMLRLKEQRAAEQEIQE